MRVVFRILKVLFALVFAVLVAGMAVGATFLLRWSRELPSVSELDQYRLEGTTKVFARDGSLIGVLAPTIGKERIDRRPVKLNEINAGVVAAIIAAEDEEFFTHYGFNPRRFAASLYNTFVKNNQQGGSTITQQMIRTTLLNNEDTVSRKIKEIMLSVQAERFFTKEEVLTLYLNTSFWGGNLYGIRAAAQAYFGKDPIDLSTAEGLYLAALLPSPNVFFKSFNRARTGMKIRLERMIENKWISRAEGNKIWLEPVRPRGWKGIELAYNGAVVIKTDPVSKKVIAPVLENPRVTIIDEIRTAQAPYFMFEIRKFLKEKYGDQAFSGGGLRVYTTLDPKAQRAAENATRVGVARRPRGNEQIALAAIDPYTGEIRALVGGNDNSGRDEFNRAASSQMRRSTGSSIKPFLYTLGIEKGLYPWTIISNEEFRLYTPGEPSRPGCPRNYYCPRNFPGSTTATGSMRFSLNWSLNFPTIRILRDYVGLQTFRDRLKMLDIETRDGIGYSSAIGGGVDVNPLQMASMYAVFVNGGTYIQPTYLRRIETADGRVLYPSQNDVQVRRKIFSPQVAYTGLDMIRGVVNDTGALAPLPQSFAYQAKIPGRDVGGKTGTTNNVVDMWFVGTTPNLVSAVWMGNDDNSAMPQNAYSGDYMPIIWGNFMKAALEGVPPSSYRVPSYVGFSVRQGVRMAYPTRVDVPENTPPPRPRPEPEPVRRPTVDTIPGAGQDRIIIAVNACTKNAAQVPPRADEFTPPRCLQNQSVELKDIALYDPNWQPPAVEPEPEPTVPN
ncbi:MAG: transglycosylase domain-containing protein [Deinococcales bacterium]